MGMMLPIVITGDICADEDPVCRDEGGVLSDKAAPVKPQEQHMKWRQSNRFMPR